jgi:methionyl-tRNA formyltransferase
MSAAPSMQASLSAARRAAGGRPLVKYVFIQDDPFYLPRLLDKYLREYSGSTRGINIQSVAQGKRGVLKTAWDLSRLYGPRYFLWKSARFAWRRGLALVFNRLLRSTRRCYGIDAVARRYGLEVTREDVNAEAFRDRLRALGVELIVSISGTQYYGKLLRDQTPAGIINCHGALLPRYRGLMPSFWTLANGEEEGGVTVHFVDEKLDNGPIVLQKRYRIHPRDTLEEIMARSKDLAAEAIIEAVRIIESGECVLLPNDESQATRFSMPTKEDVRRFRAHGHRFW